MRRLCMLVLTLFLIPMYVNSEEFYVEGEWFDYFAEQFSNGWQTVQQGSDFNLLCYTPPKDALIVPSIENYMDDIFDFYEACGLKKARPCLGQTGFFVRAFDPNNDCMYLLCFEEKKDANRFLYKYLEITINASLSPLYEPLDEIVKLFDDFAFDYIQERSRLNKNIYPFTTYPFRYSKIKKRK